MSKNRSNGRQPAGDAKRGRRKAPRWRGADPELKLRTREVCLNEFEATYGVSWDDTSEGVVRRNDLEREARRLFRELHSLMADLRRFASESPGIGWHPPLRALDGQIGPAARWLAHRALPIARDSTMAQHGATALEDQHPLNDEERVALIRRWDDYLFVEWHPPMAPRDHQIETSRQAAIVSILSGIWPNLARHDEYTPKDVIHEEEKRIGPLLKGHQRPRQLFADDED